MSRFLHLITLFLAAGVLAGSSAWAQTTSPSAGSTPNPGTAGTPTDGSNTNPYWGSSPSSYRGTSIPSVGPGLGVGTIGRSPSGFSSGFNPGFIGDVPGSSYTPRSGRYRMLRSAGASAPAYYSSAALAEAATLLPRRQPEDEAQPAEILLRVPANALVWFDGDPTRLKGTVRHYHSTPLAPYKSYSYEVRVRWMKGGKAVEETHRVRVRAGARVSLEVPRSEAGKPASTQTP
jgi:uncharacterized protein (TIGR03000 family)